MGITIGEILKYYRAQNGLSQEKLAEDICSRKYIIDLEKNKNIPTLDIVTKLSAKLGVDLYATYSSVFKYPDINTFEKSKQLSLEIGKRNYSGIEQNVIENEKKRGFLKGEARQLICYANSIICGHRGDFAEAEEWILKGLKERHESFPLKDNKGMSNLDYSLMLSLGVTQGREGRITEAINNFNILKEAAFTSLLGKYESEKNKAFYLNIVCSAAYNKFIFNRANRTSMLSEIEEILNFQKTNNRSHLLCELLLCKAWLLKRKNEYEKAEKVYNQAVILGEFYYESNRLHMLVDQIMNLE